MRIYFIIITSLYFIEILGILLFISLYKVSAIIRSAALIFFNFSYFIREHGLFEYYKIQEKLEIIGIMNFRILVLYLIKYTYLYWYFHYKDLQELKKLISWDFNI